MKKFIFFLLFSPLLFASALSTSSPVALDGFTLKSSQNIFDNAISYTHKPLLNCTPNIDAVYKVISEKELKVIPRQALVSSANYACSYEKEKFTFKTLALKVVDSNYFKESKILRLGFNDKLLASSVQKGIKLYKLDKLAKTKLNYSVLQNDAKNLVLKINEKVGAKSIKLYISKKLQTKNLTTLAEDYADVFNVHDEKVELDKEKKILSIQDAPQMVALENGQFALRIFVNDNFSGNVKDFIEIDGLETFQVHDYHYMGYDTRKKYDIKDSYYFYDVTSNEFKPNTKYKVRLKAGLSSYYRELKEDEVYKLKTYDRAKAILFNEKKKYIANVGELSFSSVNIEKVTLIVERVLNDNLRYFMNFENSNETQVPLYTKELFSKEILLDTQHNKLLRQKFKLSDLSKKELPVGVYKITLRYSEEDEGGAVEERVASKVLFLSNLGISANLSKEEALVTVLALDTAKPIKGAVVKIYGANNALLGKASTNSDGVAIIKNKQLLKLNPRGIIVQTSKDKNFLTLSETIGSPSLAKLLEKQERFKAHVYFQSTLVRPQAKINALITVKDRDFISASKLPIKIVLQELSGKVVSKKVYHTDAYGLIDFNYQLDANDKTGNYVLKVYLGERLLGSKKLKVEAFLPPKIENKISVVKEVYDADELIELNISSSYLFGAPSSYLKGKVTFHARPIAYQNQKYKNYSFVNQELAKKNVQTYIDQSEDIVLDEKGKFAMVLQSKLTQKVPSMLEAMIGVTIMDDAQPVSNYKKIKIYPYKSMVGLHLSHDSFEKGEKLEGKAILVDTHSGKLLNRELSVIVKQLDWHYSYHSGNYHWEKEVKVVDTFSINSNENFSRDVLANGDYVIEVHDYLSGHSASQSFDVWWWSYSNISPNNDLKSVEIKFEDKLYRKGDVIEVKIKSPILEGQVLLSLEGESIDNYKMLEIHKGVVKTSIKIKGEMKRGLHLHATVFRASDTPSTLIPFRAMGYKFVKPNREQHRIKVELDLPVLVKSKVPLSFSIRTDKPSKVLVSIVDVGILQLAGQSSPKLFEFFNEPASKKFAYYDLYDELLAYVTEGKLVDFGAGDALSKRQKHLAPDLGKRVKPFMIWSGIIDASDLEANINIDIPEFNGRASVVVLALNEDSLGVAKKELVVKDPVMIKPSYPLYMLKGDTIELPVRLFNTTKESKEITIDAELSNNLSLIFEEKLFTVPANASVLVTAKLKANAIGRGKIKLLAQYDGQSISKSVELPLHSPFSLETKTFKGISTEKQTFEIPKAYEGAKVYVTLSNNLLGALRDDLKYLVQYPYGCAEQTSSKLSAMHYAKPFFQKDAMLKRSEHFILQGIKKLHNMQNYHGEFNYWERGDYVHAYASLYAAQTVLDIAKSKGPVKPNFKKKIIKMLKSVAKKNGKYSGKYSNFHRVYAAYILAQNKELSSSTANMIYERGLYKGHFLATFYMAAIKKMQGKDKSANELFSKNTYDLSRYAYKTYGNQTGNFESNVRDMMLHFIIKIKYFEKNSKDLMAVQKEFSNLYSTQSKAVALKAISAYLGQPKSTKIDVSLSINGETKSYDKAQVLFFDKVTSPSIKLSPNGSAMSYSVELVKHMEKPIFNKIENNKELSIKREFIDKDGNSVDVKKLIQGDKIFSKVTIVNYGKIDNVVVNQRIPACFSIENNNIKETKATFKDENINLEHKEILDDRVLHFLNLAKKREWNKVLSKYETIENRGIMYTTLIASSIGECRVPAVITEAMYDTRINAYAKAHKSVIVKALKSTKLKAKKEAVKVTPKKEVKKEIDSLASKAQKLVKEIYTKEMHSNNPLEFANYFSYPLELYFRTKDFKKDELLADKRKYFKTWSKRIYSNMKTEVAFVDKSAKKVKVRVSFDYKIYNEAKLLTGTSKHLLTLVEKEGRLKVVSVELWKKSKPKEKKVSKKSKELSLKLQAKRLVSEIYNKEMKSNNPIEFSDYFSYPLKKYFRSENFTKDELLADKQKYFKDWAKRVYTDIKTEVVSEDPKAKSVKIKVSFSYKIYNGEKVLDGISHHLLTLEEKNGKLLVVAVELGKK